MKLQNSNDDKSGMATPTRLVRMPLWAARVPDLEVEVTDKDWGYLPVLNTALSDFG